MLFIVVATKLQMGDVKKRTNIHLQIMIQFQSMRFKLYLQSIDKHN